MKLKFFSRIPGGPEGSDPECTDTGTPTIDTGIPVSVYAGRVPNPHILYGQDDIETGPVTFARYNMSRGVHDVQMNNGWQRTNYGLRTTYASSGYLNEVMPEIPGQSRLIGMGGSPSNYVPRGPAPGQWQNVVDNVQSQPTNPGGPGQTLGVIRYNGAGG